MIKTKRGYNHMKWLIYESKTEKLFSLIA